VLATATPKRVRPAVVLLVEDDQDDQELSRRAFQRGPLHVDLRIASNGQEALDYLLGQAASLENDDPAPVDLVLLDLNMPNMDGRELLRRMRAHPKLRRIPVVVMTTSRQEEDVVRSYELGCNSFISKPVELDAFIKVLDNLGSYWFQLVTLPSR
jgi:CheY-like chemotaxis protein